MADMIPAKGERATDRLPMSADGLVTAHLVLRPAERVFDLFVALLDPGAQPVEPADLFQTGWREWRFASRALAWGWPVGDQVPSGKIRQRLWVGGGYHSAFPLFLPIRASHRLYPPPLPPTSLTAHPAQKYPP